MGKVEDDGENYAVYKGNDQLALIGRKGQKNTRGQ